VALGRCGKAVFRVLKIKNMGQTLHLQLDHNGGPLSVLQITDTHIGAALDNRLAGVDTRQSLAHVLAATASGAKADLMLLTGDLADDGSEAAYRALDEQLSPLGISQAWLPGNHDNVAHMQAVAGERMVATVGAGLWGIVMLNSQIPGAVGGQLADSELERLAQFLDNPDYQYVLVCVHHQPLPIGCRWLDQQRIGNGDRLLQMLDGCSRVRGLLWGHVHQECDMQRQHYRLLGSPSTCVQFAPGSDSFKVDRKRPGYRRLWLAQDGSLSTRVDRIDAELFDVDYDCGGY
jgi:Icc protein